MAMTVAQRMSAREFLATEFDERWVELTTPLLPGFRLPLGELFAG